MEDCRCDVIASSTAQVSKCIAVSCDGATGAYLSIAGCSSPPASQSPANLRASGASRQGPGEGDAGGCGSDGVIVNIWLVWSCHYVNRDNQLQWNLDTIGAEESVLIREEFSLNWSERL